MRIKSRSTFWWTISAVPLAGAGFAAGMALFAALLPAGRIGWWLACLGLLVLAVALGVQPAQPRHAGVSDREAVLAAAQARLAAVKTAMDLLELAAFQEQLEDSGGWPLRR